MRSHLLTFNNEVRAQLMTGRTKENSNIKHVNSRDARDEESGGELITISIVSNDVSENQSSVDAKINMIRNSICIKGYFWMVF